MTDPLASPRSLARPSLDSVGHVVAAFDCGTNTIKLLISRLDPETGEETELVRDMRMVRLGQGVDRTGRLDPEAIARTFAAIDEFKATMAGYPIERMRFCATSASRDASNADEFVAGVRERLGILPEVVSGAEEAQLSYDGATRSLGVVDGQVEGPIVVIDLGGGSTELIVGDAHGHVTAGHSLDIGSVRIHERLLAGDPPSAAEIAEAARVIDAALDTLPAFGVDISAARTVVGVAGTITTIAAAVLDLPTYQREAIHHAVLSRESVLDTCDRLLGMSVAERRALGFLHPGRADVIGAGALILDRVLRRTDRPELLVSESDILDGIAWSMTEPSEARASD
ncbi:Ppx/GppA phosphatase family protein [Nocardioides cavernaquae]|uniref:Ppx/GppA family phosphatase n=1 Tax=Nocardioides cavernaquae TaxID=2321396 RepID=A0A3A5H3F3_9ACTN|nr:Ppx/GppA phosphatase family protein [Nocardioides cavernaquae]RJS45296.1 Ppx/GppA family phosphatase [Nocardioides cavernaquae]